MGPKGGGYERNWEEMDQKRSILGAHWFIITWGRWVSESELISLWNRYFKEESGMAWKWRTDHIVIFGAVKTWELNIIRYSRPYFRSLHPAELMCMILTCLFSSSTFVYIHFVVRRSVRMIICMFSIFILNTPPIYLSSFTSRLIGPILFGIPQKFCFSLSFSARKSRSLDSTVRYQRWTRSTGVACFTDGFKWV